MKINPYRSVIFLLATMFFLACQPEDQNSGTVDKEPSNKVLAEGQRLFDGYCSGCHNFRASGIGPNLAGITEKVKREWLVDMIRNSKQLIDSGDERAEALFASYKQYMPPFEMLKDEEIDAVIAFMATHKSPEKSEFVERYENPLQDPIPEKIQLSGFQLTIREIARAPQSGAKPLMTRINKMAPLTDGSGRLFIHDQEGQLYELTAEGLKLFFDLRSKFPRFISLPGKGSGLGSFAFHPEYAENGLIYTSHTEQPEGSAPADFTYPDSIPVALRWVVSEWKDENRTDHQLSGSRRELLRIDMVSGVHGMQEIAFNPEARPGDKDYGLLYIGIGDGGAVGRGYAYLLQTKRNLWGSILRIDPLGSNGKNGQYGIPADNPFAASDDPAIAGEIWAYGFRNPHRFDWHQSTLLAPDIGQHQVEEINLVLPGRKYGWPEREGTFIIDPYGDLAKVYALAADDDQHGYTYPVLQFDHDEGIAISSGFVYKGKALPELAGKYIFGTMVSGRIFFADFDALQLGRQAPIYEIQLADEQGQAVTLRSLSGEHRVALRFGMDAHNELYLFTKADGRIYKVVKANLNSSDLES